jgi:Cu(I)/Ag(I) efflux system membrane fusion protein
MRALFLVVILFIAPAALAQETYICPMHPHIHGEEGETCPICGMTLVAQAPQELPAKPSRSKEGDQPAVQISPDFIQALGVTTATAQARTLAARVQAYGEVVPSSRNALALSMRSEGWIIDLAADAVGDTVNKGDLLFTYYSPEIISAQVDYLTVAATESRVERAEQRLRLYGMEDKAIAEFKARGKVIEQMPFYAPFDGTITELPIRKGDYLQAGELALGLQDFSQVWVNAAIALRDLPLLEVGQQANIRNPATGQRYSSTIEFIHHVADPESRTGKVRLSLPHDRGEPKPGSYVDVEFQVNPGARLAVPSQALLYDRDGAYLFLDLGEGRFQPRRVETGVTSEGYTEILSGLEQGQNIVTAGQFLIDAESRLRSGMSRMENMSHGDDRGESMPATGMEAHHAH